MLLCLSAKKAFIKVWCTDFMLNLATVERATIFVIHNNLPVKSSTKNSCSNFVACPVNKIEKELYKHSYQDRERIIQAFLSVVAMEFGNIYRVKTIKVSLTTAHFRKRSQGTLCPKQY